MKIVKILGGLGNQMFQYALFVALKQRFPEERVMVDTSCFRGYPLHNGYEIDDIFSLNSDVATWKDIARIAYPYPNYKWWKYGKHILPNRSGMCVEKKDCTFIDNVFSQMGDMYYEGYWQCEEYFSFVKREIYKAFNFPRVTDERNEEIITKVQETNSVSIHIRRGDYVNHPWFKGICEIDYYRKGILYLEENVKPDLYCVLSNDVDWCKEGFSHLIPQDKVVYVDWNKGRESYVDMQIMSLCKHNIIANSSFSWWGAWLNQNPQKIVLAPSKWKNIELATDPVPTSWIKI